MQLGNVRLAFAADDLCKLVLARACARDELQIEIVAVAGRGWR
jgi:hypothetical protein